MCCGLSTGFCAVRLSGIDGVFGNAPRVPILFDDTTHCTQRVRVGLQQLTAPRGNDFETGAKQSCRHLYSFHTDSDTTLTLLTPARVRTGLIDGKCGPAYGHREHLSTAAVNVLHSSNGSSL